MTDSAQSLSAAEKAIKASSFIAAAAESAGAHIEKFHLYEEDTSRATFEIALPDANIEWDGETYNFPGFHVTLTFNNQISVSIYNDGSGEEHPHVSGGAVCTGYYNDYFVKAAQAEDWRSMFASLIACINTYSPNDCFNRISVEYVQCSSCAADVDEEYARWCNVCLEPICSDCYYICHECGYDACPYCSVYYEHDIWTGIGWRAVAVRCSNVCQNCERRFERSLLELRRDLIRLANTQERKMKLCGLIGMVRKQRKSVAVLKYHLSHHPHDFWTWLEVGLRQKQRLWGCRRLPF